MCARGRPFHGTAPGAVGGASFKILTATATATARGRVQGIAQEEVPALRALIAAEARRFPRLGRAWREQGPERFAEPLAAALRACPELEIPDRDVAIIQFYALVLYPHVVHSPYGDRLPPAEQLIERGVDMFLEYYRNGWRESAARTWGNPADSDGRPPRTHRLPETTQGPDPLSRIRPLTWCFSCRGGGI
ncbi:TetR/AcrR family transcriptional regulator C-terminal domain-containing protein [Streptomyces sp. NPDC002466]|uniref:TetR/AcrR family transcriptional regulator C-terminal domain-containing protein n=1 Tax=Streptomyces sp. NPDC002466 TaxID=3364646 RepID=UPI003677A78D